jgi:antirestriction protein ArdC
VATNTKSKRSSLEEVHGELVEAVMSLVSADDWVKFLDTARRFHRYSLNNVLLILAQAPEATQVASYRTWQGLGRQVRKGEKGIRILAPCRYRRTDDGADAKGESGEYVIRGFTVVSVFDVSQTEGEELPTVAKPRILEGDVPNGMWESIASLIEKDGFSVARADCGAANGETRFATREVVVAPHLPDRAAAKTLCHELAHVRMHKDDLARRTRDIAEVEAESCAFIVARAWGLDSSDYSIPYVAHWAQSPQVVRDTMQRVVATARHIIGECELT